MKMLSLLIILYRVQNKKKTSSLCIVAPNALYKYANDGVVECKP